MGAPYAIVPKVLTKENYGRWKIWMKNYLLGEELWDIVDETEPRPDQATQVAEFRAWRKKNGKALHAIQVCCGEEAFDHISEIDSAKDAWNLLAFMHQQQFTQNPTEVPGPSQDQSTDDKAVVKGDWESTKRLLDSHPEALSARLSMGETILHTAVLLKHVQLVMELVEKMKTEDLELALPYESNSTALHLAAYGGIVKIAEILVNKNDNLLRVRDELGYLTVTRAFLTGRKDMARYLYSVTPEEELNLGNIHNGADLFIATIADNDYDFALDIYRRFPQFTTAQNCHGLTALKRLATMPSAFPSGSRLRFWQRWIYNCWFL